MTKLLRIAISFPLLVFCWASYSSPTEAGFIQIFSSAELIPGFSTTDFPEPPGSFLGSPYTLTMPNNVLTFTHLGGDPFIRFDLGGHEFIYNGGFSTAPLSVAFAVPVTQFAIPLLSNTTGDTTFFVTVFDGATPLGTFTNSGPYGSLVFAGGRAVNGSQITSFEISSATNDCAVCDVSFTPVPEPSGFALFAVGFAALIVFAASIAVKSFVHEFYGARAIGQ